MVKEKIGTKLVISMTLMLTLVMIAGMVWNVRVQKKQAQLELSEQSRILAVQVLALRTVTIENQQKINYDSQGNFEFKHLNPTAVVQQVSGVFNTNTNYLIRQVRFNPRLPENKPDDYEKKWLLSFTKNKKLKESFGESIINGEKYFRYMAPLYFSPSCMECHGEPKGKIDISGHLKEGYKTGDLAGALSIAIPMKIKETHLKKSILQSVLLTLITVIFSAGIIIFHTNLYVTKPIERLIRFSQNLAKGNLSIRPDDFKAYGEIQELKDRFSDMADQLQEMYASLESKVEERTLELAGINQELARVNQYKSEFLANMSHEFRTPLTAILAFTDALLKKNMGSISSEQEAYLRDIKDSGNQLLAMVNDLLDLSKIESGKMSLNLTEVDIGTVALDVEKILRPLAQQKEIVVRTTATNTRTVIADQTLVRQVIQNLLGNAIKFSPEGSIVYLLVFDETTADDGIILMVKDYGSGILPEDLELIFAPFYQVDRGLKREYPGTGLGLALVKKIVDAHTGWIEVQSDVGQGTIFKIFWPAYPMLDKDLE